jgi:hypothetical protein
MIWDETTIPWIVIGGGLLLVCIIYIRAFVTWVGGIWYEQKEPGGPILEIHLKQIGPLIWGYALVPGGVSRYRGWFNGSLLRLRRRDFGRDYFMHLGFPEEILSEIEGSEMARASLYNDPLRRQLVGEHFPQKIEISRNRPRQITERFYLPPVPRKWVRDPRNLLPQSP